MLAAACLLAAAAAAEPLVGGDADANGCIASAGYTYCKSLGKCIRSWESSCVDLEEATKGEKEGEDKTEEDGEEAEGPGLHALAQFVENHEDYSMRHPMTPCQTLPV